MNKFRLAANDIEKELSKKYNVTFGRIAVENGYVTSEQIWHGLLEQRTDDLADRPHRLLGRILFDNGWMTAPQIEEVLKQLFNRKRAEKDPADTAAVPA